jgi:hypothetical protein
MTIDHIVTLLLAVPAVGLIPLYVFRNDPRSVKQVAVVTTLVELVLSLVMRARPVSSWSSRRTGSRASASATSSASTGSRSFWFR